MSRVRHQMRLLLVLSGPFVIFLGTAVSAQENQLILSWNDLAPVISGHRIAMTLPAGVDIEGKVLRVQPDVLEIDVTKTSDNRVQGEGRASIPRSSVSRFQLKRNRVRGRIIGTAIGALLGIAYWYAAAVIENEQGTGPGEAGILFVPLGAGGGYLLGHLADRSSTTIVVASSSDR